MLYSPVVSLIYNFHQIFLLVHLLLNTSASVLFLFKETGIWYFLIGLSVTIDPQFISSYQLTLHKCFSFCHGRVPTGFVVLFWSVYQLRSTHILFGFLLIQNKFWIFVFIDISTKTRTVVFYDLFAFKILLHFYFQLNPWLKTSFESLFLRILSPTGDVVFGFLIDLPFTITSMILPLADQIDLHKCLIFCFIDYSIKQVSWYSHFRFDCFVEITPFGLQFLSLF